MTSKEALEIIKKYDDYASIRFLTKRIVSPKTMGSPNEEDFKEAIDIIEQDLEVLDFFRKLFVNIMPMRLTDLQDEKYLAIPSSDIRRPDALLPITEKEYELLKEWFRNNLLNGWLENDKRNDTAR